MRDPTSRRAVGAAALTATGLLLICGSAYWLLARELARPAAAMPLPAGSLAKLPLRVGGEWAGQEMPLTAELITATATDDRLYRVYQRRAGTEVVGLYIAYGIRGRDLMPHRPEVCYPGAGWTQRSRETIQLSLLERAAPLECTLYTFGRSGLLTETMYVLNYYIVDGRYSPDVSLLRSRAWRGAGGVRYMAQVQVTVSGGAMLAREQAVESARQFAAASAGPIRALLPADEGGAS